MTIRFSIISSSRLDFVLLLSRVLIQNIFVKIFSQIIVLNDWFLDHIHLEMKDKRYFSGRWFRRSNVRRFFSFSPLHFHLDGWPPLLLLLPPQLSSSTTSIIKYNTGLDVSQIIVARPRRRDTLRLACQLDTVYEVTKYARSLHRAYQPRRATTSFPIVS